MDKPKHMNTNINNIKVINKTKQKQLNIYLYVK